MGVFRGIVVNLQVCM